MKKPPCIATGKAHAWKHVCNENVPYVVRGQMLHQFRGYYKCVCGANRHGKVR